MRLGSYRFTGLKCCWGFQGVRNPKVGKSRLFCVFLSGWLSFVFRCGLRDGFDDPIIATVRRHSNESLGTIPASPELAEKWIEVNRKWVFQYYLHSTSIIQHITVTAEAKALLWLVRHPGYQCQPGDVMTSYVHPSCNSKYLARILTYRAWFVGGAGIATPLPNYIPHMWLMTYQPRMFPPPCSPQLLQVAYRTLLTYDN